MKHMVGAFPFFSNFCRLKLNLPKCEIIGTGVLKGVQMAAEGVH